MITAISPLAPIGGQQPIEQTGSTGALESFGGIFQSAARAALNPFAAGEDEEPVGSVTGLESIGGIFQSAVNAVKETDAEKTQLQYLMATGQLDNPAELMMASSKAEMSVSLLVQLRNRAVDAYNEMMRISL